MILFKKGPTAYSNLSYVAVVSLFGSNVTKVGAFTSDTYSSIKADYAGRFSWNRTSFVNSVCCL